MTIACGFARRFASEHGKKRSSRGAKPQAIVVTGSVFCVNVPP